MRGYLGIPEVCRHMVRKVAELESKDLVHDIRSTQSFNS